MRRTERVDWLGLALLDPRHRLAADPARARRAPGLVRVAGDPDRGRRWRAIGARRRSSGTSSRTEHPIVDLRILKQPPARRRRRLRRRPRLRALRQRLRAPGLPPEPAGLHRLGHRARDPPRRHRERVHDGGDGPAGHPGRRPDLHHDRRAALPLVDVAALHFTTPIGHARPLLAHDPARRRARASSSCRSPAPPSPICRPTSSPRAPASSICPASWAAASASRSTATLLTRFTEQEPRGAAPHLAAASPARPSTG